MVLAALALSAAACVRLPPPTMPELPAAVLDRAVLCADVVRTDDWADLSLVGTAFRKDRDVSICAVLIFKPMTGRHRLAWKWYDPSGRLVRESDTVGIGEDGFQYDRYLAWDRIPVEAETSAGRWTVVFFVDDAAAGSLEFDLAGSAGINPGWGCGGSGRRGSGFRATR